MKKNLVFALVLLSLLIVLGTFVPYLQTFDFGLIDFDDYEYVGRNSFVVRGVSFAAVREAFTSVEHAIWMPLTWFSYMLDFSWFAGNPRAMHAHSVLIHLLNALLLFGLLVQLQAHAAANSSKQISVANLIVASIATLLWSAHPLRVESVAWVASRKDVLSLFWELVALICWVKFRTAKTPWQWYLAALAGFGMGSLAKPSVMTFPCLVLIIDWLILGKVRLGDLFRGRASGEKGSIPAYFPYLLPLGYAAILGYFAAHAQAAGEAMDNLGNVPLWWKCFNACASFGVYCRNTLVPTQLSPLCVVQWPNPPKFAMMGVAMVILAGSWMVLQIRMTRHAELLAGLLWFTLALGPFMGVVGFGYHAFADRFTYIPALGISIAVTCALARLNPSYAYWLILPVLALIPITHKQVSYWGNDEILYHRVLEVDGTNNTEAWMGLGMYYFEFQHDKLELAVGAFNKAYNADSEAAGKIGPLYIIALCESGQSGEAGKIVSWYSDWADRHFAKKDNDPFSKNKPHYLFRIAKAIWYAHQKHQMKDAIMELKDLEPSMRNNIDYLYAKGRIEWMNGNHDQARAIWKTMLEEGTGEEYILYRFTDKL